MSIPNGKQEQTPSNFFFPLRTNVHYFDTPEGQMALEDRVKEASLLYDNLLFEGGMYEATVWANETNTGPSMDMWTSPADLTPEFLADRTRSFRPRGGDAYLLFDQHTFANGEVARSLRSEFHTILQKIHAEQLPWIGVETFNLTSTGSQAVSRAQFEDEHLLDDLLSDAPRFLKSKIVSNLNRDLLIISGLQSAAAMDPMFAPLLERKAQRAREIQPALGNFAFRVAVPNVTQLPWEKIIDLREQDCLKEFRHKMQEIEALARQNVSTDGVRDLRFEISQILNDEFLKEIENMAPSSIKVAADVTCDFLLGFIPWASTVMTGLTGIGGLEAFNQTWMAAFIKLRRPQ